MATATRKGLTKVGSANLINETSKTKILSPIEKYYAEKWKNFYSFIPKY